jgi:hypothetical protein
MRRLEEPQIQFFHRPETLCNAAMATGVVDQLWSLEELLEATTITANSER